MRQYNIVNYLLSTQHFPQNGDVVFALHRSLFRLGEGMGWGHRSEVEGGVACDEIYFGLQRVHISQPLLNL